MATERRSDGELHVAAAIGARLVLPYDAPDEYDLDVSFTRTSGEHSIALFFLAGSGQATFEVDAWGEHMAGIQNVGGLTMQAPSVPADRRALDNGRRYTARVQVRRGRVSAYLDRELVAEYEGDGSDLSVLDLWQLPRTNVLGIGAYESDTTFHSIRVRPR